MKHAIAVGETPRSPKGVAPGPLCYDDRAAKREGIMGENPDWSKRGRAGPSISIGRESFPPLPVKEMPLLKSQRNSIAELLQAFGFAASEFEWSTQKSHFIAAGVTTLVHLSSGYYYCFEFLEEGTTYSRYSP